MTLLIRAVLISSGLLISSCASMNKDQCQMADWQALGYQQGSQGHSMTRFNSFQEDCAKHHIKADFSAFKAGHQQGLQGYCTFDQGLNTGKQGADYNALCSRSQFPAYQEGHQSGINRYCNFSNGVSAANQGKGLNSNCPTTHYPEFHRGYAQGQEQRQLSQHLNALEDDLDNIQEAMENANDRINAAEAIIISETSTVDSRKQALEDIKFYKKQHNQLDRDYHDKLNERDSTKQQYNSLLQP